MKSGPVYRNITKKILAPPASESFFEKKFNIVYYDFQQVYSISFNPCNYLH